MKYFLKEILIDIVSEFTSNQIFQCKTQNQKDFLIMIQKLNEGPYSNLIVFEVTR